MAADGLFDIDTLLDEVVTLPSLPDSVAKLNEMLNDPDVELKAVAHVISSDPAIALKTLRLVNSAYYGLGQEVTNVEHASVLLGAKVLKNLVMTATAFDCMKSSATSFLRHSVACGMAMKAIARTGGISGFHGTEDEAFTFGLIHDIGKVILEEYLPDEYQDVRDAVQEDGIPWYRAERRVIGVDHAELGGSLAQNWKLTPPVVNAIRSHHDLADCPAEFQGLAASLSIANQICNLSGYRAHPENYTEAVDDMFPVAGIDSGRLPAITEEYFNSRGAIEELLALAD